MKAFAYALILVFCQIPELSSANDHPPIELTKSGEARAIIVTASSPSSAAKTGAKILSDHVFQISGARLKIVTEDKLKSDATLPHHILVGKSDSAEKLGIDAESLKPGEIIIQTFPNAIVLLGNDDPESTDPDGTRYAVCTFLENSLGVRFLWPGELGKVVPKQADLSVPKIDLRFAPILLQRKIRMGSSFTDRMERGGEQLGITKEDYDKKLPEARATKSFDSGWSSWHRLGGSLQLASGHSFGDAWKKWGKDHPEWFAMAPNGSRDQSSSASRARLCVSNSDLIEAVAKDRIATINKTGQTSISIGPNDGGTTSFCVCPECEALDAPTDRKIELIDFSPGADRRKFEHVPLTDRYIYFWNKIAERVTEVHPDVWLTADAYSAYSAPPVKAKLHPNIAIRYVGVTYLNEERRHQGLADWDAWAKAASKIYFRSNLLLAGRREGTPVVYVHKLADDFKKLAPNRMIGTDLDSCMHNWATQGLNYYVMSKLLWDPDLDVDELIDDYCRSGFGAGAESVKQYFLLLEELTNQIAEGESAVTDPFTPDVVADLRAHLEKADKATKDEPGSNARVAFLRTGLEYTDAYTEIFRINKEWEKTGGRLTPEMKVRFEVALDRNWELSRKIFEEKLLAVNVTNVAWGSWGYFKRFQWKSPSLEKKPN